MKVGAVIVSYHPDDLFESRVSNIARSVDHVVVVDNTPNGARASFVNNRVIYIELKNNFGIARALNVGVSKLLDMGCELSFLFDQDSEPSSKVFKTMLHSYANFFSTDGLVILGTSYFDTRMNVWSPFISFNGFRLERRSPLGVDKLIPADYIITSGTLLSRRVWERVGEFDESLFIDYVDIEWCLRAKNKGVSIYGEPRCVMTHTLGDEPISVFGRRLPVHSPIRHYYFFRNCISLLRRNYIPMPFKVREFCILPIRFFVYALFTRNKSAHISKMCRGILDGLLSKSGPYQ
ncbi:glycosyltransferase family 2 protein [Aeromonas veronii]|uniref:glycosyltransferase family 2 protein n=1 Tax=Aeromonas veronii TaxID=654 RepID=UPI0038D283BE